MSWGCERDGGGSSVSDPPFMDESSLPGDQPSLVTARVSPAALGLRGCAGSSLSCGARGSAALCSSAFL